MGRGKCVDREEYRILSFRSNYVYFIFKEAENEFNYEFQISRNRTIR